jgi:hypothetical protein
MLAEYFSLGITAEGAVECLPLLLRNYTPNLDKLPGFLMRLGPQVRAVVYHFGGLIGPFVLNIGRLDSRNEVLRHLPAGARELLHPWTIVDEQHQRHLHG